jgi:ribosomal protein S18 acetylase RimI-like enzyme
MAWILARCRGLTDLTLGVEPNNERALRLYRAMGYQAFHRYRGKNGATIIGMRKTLSWPDDP